MPGNRGDLVVRGGIVVTMDPQRRILEEGHVVIREGRIQAVGEGSPPRTSRDIAVLDAPDGVILPGLVNAHEHLDQALYRGLFDDMVPAQRWEPLVRFASRQTQERAYAAARQTLLELTRSGVTTTTESYWVQSHPGSMRGVCQAVAESGLRGILARAMNDYAPPGSPGEGFTESWDQVRKEILQLNRDWGSEKITVIPEAISLLRTRPETVVSIESFAREQGTLWATHIATGDIRAIVERTGRGLTHYLKDLGVLKENLLAAHCNVMYPGEARLMAQAGTRLAHAPVAQLWQGSPVADIMELLEAGVRVGLGVDGALTNNSQNVFESMKFAVYAQQQIHRNQLIADAQLGLELATIRAAQALDMEDEVGSLEAGKAGDLIILDSFFPGLRPLTALIRNLVYSCSDEAVRDVIVAGIPVMLERKHRMFDEREIILAASECQREMLSESGLDGLLGNKRGWIGLG